MGGCVGNYLEEKEAAALPAPPAMYTGTETRQDAQNDALRLSRRIWNSPAMSPLRGTNCDHRVFFQTQKRKHRHGLRHWARPRHLWESGCSGQWGAREAFEVGSDKMHLKAGVHVWTGMGAGGGGRAGSSH